MRHHPVVASSSKISRYGMYFSIEKRIFVLISVGIPIFSNKNKKIPAHFLYFRFSYGKTGPNISILFISILVRYINGTMQVRLMLAKLFLSEKLKIKENKNHPSEIDFQLRQ